MTDEIFFSAMFKAYSPEVAVNYVNSVDIFKKHSEKAEEEIRKGTRNTYPEMTHSELILRC